MKCKLKPIIIILSMFLLVSIVYGAEDVECQISQNNLTWNSTNTTLFDPAQDDPNGLLSIQNLVADTEYYIRCKNSTTEWGYDTFTTAEAGGGLDEMELAMVIGIAAMAFFFLWFSFNLKDNHFFLKLLLIFFSIISLLALPNAVMSGEDGLTGLIMLKIVTWFFRIFLMYIAVYLFWHWAQKSERFQQAIEKVRRKRE